MESRVLRLKSDRKFGFLVFFSLFPSLFFREEDVEGADKNIHRFFYFFKFLWWRCWRERKRDGAEGKVDRHSVKSSLSRRERVSLCKQSAARRLSGRRGTRKLRNTGGRGGGVFDKNVSRVSLRKKINWMRFSPRDECERSWIRRAALVLRGVMGWGGGGGVHPDDRYIWIFI